MTRATAVMSVAFLDHPEVQRAYQFAKAAHAAKDQRRKYTGEPYIEHPLAVAGLVSAVPHTFEMLMAALLHDVVEDTDVSLLQIREAFGGAVTGMVAWLTDTPVTPGLNRKQRKALDRARLAGAPGDVQSIKVADLIENSASILQHDPDFARVYLPEKAELLAVLTAADPLLRQRAHSLLTTALDTLVRRPPVAVS